MKAAMMVPGADGGRWEVRDVQRPVVTAGHVLVSVRASSLNRTEFRRLHTLRIRAGQTPPEARTGGGDAARRGGRDRPRRQRHQARRPGHGAMRRRVRRICPAGRPRGDARSRTVVMARGGMRPDRLCGGSRRSLRERPAASRRDGAGHCGAVRCWGYLLLAKFLGAKVIGTSRSADKLERLKAHGLDVGIATGSEGFGEALSRAIGADGVDMVVDNIGADYPASTRSPSAAGS